MRSTSAPAPPFPPAEVSQAPVSGTPRCRFGASFWEHVLCFTVTRIGSRIGPAEWGEMPLKDEEKKAK